MILFLFTMYGHQVKIIMLHYVTNSQSFDIKFVQNENFFLLFINQVFKKITLHIIMWNVKEKYYFNTEQVHTFL